MAARPPETRPYHLMNEEERRAAWASLRERQSTSARRHRRTPLVFLIATIGLFAAGLSLAHFRVPWAGFLLWAGVGTAGFTVISFLRHAIGSITSRKDDLTPPGF